VREGRKEVVKQLTLLGIEVVLDGPGEVEAARVDADDTSTVSLELGNEGGIVSFILRGGGRGRGG